MIQDTGWQQLLSKSLEYLIYDGRQVIRPETLRELDTAAVALGSRIKELPEYEVEDGNSSIFLSTREKNREEVRVSSYIQRVREYPAVLYVGINYDKKAKRHQCIIEQFKDVTKSS